jgi:diaminohydroxyphosphoribosylaminopyrimidine deaminase / 5-amino-6-(5-phosphoribosylamino)uracil reductase
LPLKIDYEILIPRASARAERGMSNPPPDRDADLRRMQTVVDLARRGRPTPDPPTAALVVAGDEVVGESFRQDSASSAPEVVALEAAGDRAKGAVLYVSLEPDNAEGQEAPPVEAILSAGIRRVVIGAAAPEKTGRGGAAERLRSAGLEVEVGVFGAEARTVIAPWVKHVTTGIPFVALKLALSLDGRIASRSGASKWVTGPEARVKVQQLRTHHDAVAIGIGTALADDPRLTVRDAALLSGRTGPIRIIFDTKLRIQPSARVVDTAREVPTWICAGEEGGEDAEQILTDAGCNILRVAQTAEGRIDMASALAALGEAGIVTILFEGGAELAGTLLAGRLADELHAFVAPILLGPRGRPGAVDWAGPENPAEAPRIVDPRWEVCGQDAYVHGPLSYPKD